MFQLRLNTAFLSTILIGALVPIICAIVFHFYLQDWIWVHHPFHSMIEGLGAFAALMLATIITMSRRHKRLDNRYLWVSVALIGMGVLDGFHSVLHAGNTFVWMHSIATMVGGVAMALVLLPAHLTEARLAQMAPLIILVIAIFFGTGSLMLPEWIPVMATLEGFTFPARTINFIGGTGFIFAWLYFLQRYSITRKKDKLLLAHHCLLFGVAGILFEFSTLWDATWWLWHVLRLVAYYVLLAYFLFLYNLDIKRYRILYDDNPTMLFTLDITGNVLSVNHYGAEQLGYEVDELIMQPVFNVFREDDKDAVRSQINSCFAQPDSVHHWEMQKIRKDGSHLWVKETGRVVKDENNSPTIFIVCEDVSERHKLSEELSYQATHDVLTGLINRSEFERRTERLLITIRLDKREHALCYMDLDQFKVVNDTCGHIAGDEMLRQLSSVLQDAVRHRDTLARLGGDEFGVLMEHCSLDDAHRVATSLQKVIQDYQFIWEGHSFKVGVSMGLVAITETTANLTQLLRDADAACYMAKDKGRNRIHVYYAEDAEMARRHGEMQWVTRINRAFEEDRFCLYAQIIVPLDGRTDTHYELLLRMEDEKGEIILPGAFLPAAERYNLVAQLDCWVIENTFGLLADNPQFLEQINFCSINLSGHSIADKTFLNFVITQLDESGIDGDKICFEITETAAISNLNSAGKFISTLKELGCRFALDDFGSGLSSFAYLKRLPVDYLKIDGMFVKNIVDDPIDHAMVKSINEIGQVMGMKTIAEFVENDEIKDMLRDIGVNYAQGFGIGKPHPFDELLD